MNRTAVAFVGVASLLAAACGGGTGARPDAGGGPGPVPQREGVLYEGALWTRATGGTFGPATCRSRRSLPGCELFTDPVLIAAATEGSRLVVLVARDTALASPQWDLLVSDDLGATVRRFALDGVTGNGRLGNLHLFGGRIFVLASLTDPDLHTIGSARVFEVDPVGGAITARGGAGTLSAAAGHVAVDGKLTTVDFARTGQPQIVGITRFDPATNTIRRDDVACVDDACAVGPGPFVSGDGETFDLLTRPDTGSRRCLVTVRVSSLVAETECPSTLPTDDVLPISSFGGAPYDFLFVTPQGGAAWSLVPVTRHWIPAGPPLLLGENTVFWKGGSFFAFSPPELAAVGDDVLLRLDAGGTMKKTAVQHEGCLTVGPYVAMTYCSQAVAVLPLAGEGVLFVGRRDEFQDDTRSRILFEVGQSRALFEVFEPLAMSPSR